LEAEAELRVVEADLLVVEVEVKVEFDNAELELA
jgi:hypothetical protein